MNTTQIPSYAAQSAASRLAPFTIPRRLPQSTDVAIDILYCGVCHSDIHTGRNEWPGTMYPCVPGHEIVGRVTAVGGDVSKFKVGDLAAVGCMVDSCRTCVNCEAGLEQYCVEGLTGTYNGRDTVLGGHTFGGYSTHIVVEERFVLRVPENLDLKAVAPLLCAGITTYSPLRHWKVGKGTKVGIVGLGGLGHMGVKFAHALGAHTVLFTTSPGKVEDGKKLGADEVIISKHEDEMKKQAASFDFILDCVSRRARHQCLPEPAQARRHALPSRRAGKAAARAGFQLAPAAAQLRGLSHRRHSRNPGDARFLWRARHRARRGDDPDGLHQRSLGSRGQGGREIPLRHRHGFAQKVNCSVNSRRRSWKTSGVRGSLLRRSRAAAGCLPTGSRKGQPGMIRSVLRRSNNPKNDAGVGW